MSINIYFFGKLLYGQTLYFECLNLPTELKSISKLRFSCKNENEWFCEIEELPTDIDYIQGKFIIKNCDQKECYLIKEYRFLKNNQYSVRYYNLYEYTREINRARGIPDFKYLSATDGEIWCSIQWLIRNARFQPADLTVCDSIEPFNPKVCHRKLFKVQINNKYYLFSPVGYANNKFTPLNEILNYKLAQLLNPPDSIYIPETTDVIIDQDDYHLGYGSLKTFIKITNTNVWIQNLPKDVCSWVQLFDFLIVNIERDWNDHLCQDEYGKICLLDNDMNLYHLDKFKNFNFNRLDNLSNTVKKKLYQLNENKHIIYNSIQAPDIWYKVIFNRLNKVIHYYDSIE